MQMSESQVKRRYHPATGDGHDRQPEKPNARTALPAFATSTLPSSSHAGKSIDYVDALILLACSLFATAREAFQAVSLFLTGILSVVFHPPVSPPSIVAGLTLPPLLIDEPGLDDAVLECFQTLETGHTGLSNAFIGHLSAVSRALVIRYQTTGSLDDLDGVVRLCDDSLGKLDDAHPARGIIMCDLAEALRARARPRGAPADLARAVALCRDALTFCAPGFLERSRALDDLGLGLRYRFLQSGDRGDLEDALALHEEALALRLPGHPFRDRALANSAVALTIRFGERGNPEDLELAIGRNRESLALRPAGHTERVVVLNSLAIGMMRRFEKGGARGADDLDEAIGFLQEALDLTTRGHPGREIALGTLAAALIHRNHYSGEVADLDHAIELLKASLELRKPGNMGRPIVLGNLANALQTRYLYSGDVYDLEQAISRNREALELVGAQHPLRSNHLFNLSNNLHERFEVTDQAEDLDEAIRLSEESLELRPLPHPARMDSLHAIGRCLLSRFKERRDSADLERAIEVHEQALEQAGINHKKCALFVRELAEALQMRFTALGHQTDALSAVDLATRALSILVPGRGNRSECLFQLARFRLLSESPAFDASAGLEHLHGAITDPHRNAQLRLKEGLSVLGRLDDSVCGQAAQVPILAVYSALVGLLPRVAYFGLDVRSRLGVLGKADSLARSAASRAIKLGKFEAGVELLEAGRGIFWTQALRLRTPFDALPVDLARELRKLSKQLETDSLRVVQDDADAADYRRRQTAKFEALLDQVRALPGFLHFMLPDAYSTLCESAKEGPVVVLLADERGCLALVIREHGLDKVELPGVTLVRLRELGGTVQDQNFQFRDSGIDDSRMGMKVVKSAEDIGHNLLSELWATIVAPVVLALGLKKQEGRERPRVWWCPTGPFVTLPLHAAGIYRREGECCSDYLVSSYTPTLRALITARRGLAGAISRAKNPKILVAAVPRPPIRSWLPHAVSEVEAIKSVVPLSSMLVLPDTEDVILSPNAGVTTGTLIDLLPGASILHLACHGQQARGDALNSGFVLQDGVLTLAQLMRLDLPNATLACLSACETAKGDDTQPDQNVHLAAAMMFAGFRSVVGTMWTMGDRDGPVVASAVYRALFKDEQLDLDAIPYAVDEAVRALRDEGVQPHRWVTYIHLGA